MGRRPETSDSGGEVRWSKTSWSAEARRRAKHSGNGGKGKGPSFSTGVKKGQCQWAWLAEESCFAAGLQAPSRTTLRHNHNRETEIADVE